MMCSPREEWPTLIKLRGAVTRENAPVAELLRRVGSAAAACEAPPVLWEEVCGFRPDPQRLGTDADRRAERAARELDEIGGRVLDVRQPSYPAALQRLPQPPPILFLVGRVELLDRPGIAVVGTRQHSAYGRDVAASFAVGLARAGYVVVSGMARGIDSIAHRAAVEAGGDTVAVLGNGLEIVYPPEHEDLRTAIAARGCLVTEFPPGTPPRKHHFPQRNRIIAGLARAVLVVEAPERSGALITAEYAMEEGKEVFAVPGPIHNSTSRGPHRLIQDGAALVTSVADLVVTLQARADEPVPEPAATVAAGAAEPSGADAAGAPHGASELAHRIWEVLADGSLDADALAAALSARAEALVAALVELELAGLVERLPGPRYARVHARSPIGSGRR